LKKGFDLPAGAARPVEPGGITTLAVGTLAKPFAGDGGDVCCYPYNYFLYNVETVDPVAEMIYWQRLDGGRVFNGGAIGNGIALYYNDAVFIKLMQSVLTNFLGP
jgi:hypothetical protein